MWSPTMRVGIMLPDGILNASMMLERMMSTRKMAMPNDLTFSMIHCLRVALVDFGEPEDGAGCADVGSSAISSNDSLAGFQLQWIPGLGRARLKVLQCAFSTDTSSRISFATS